MFRATESPNSNAAHFMNAILSNETISSSVQHDSYFKKSGYREKSSVEIALRCAISMLDTLTVCIANSAAKATDLIVIMLELSNELGVTVIHFSSKLYPTRKRVGVMDDDEKPKTDQVEVSI